MIRSRYRLSQGIVPIDENHISIVSIWRHRPSPASATVRQAGAMARLNASRAVFQPIESRKAHDPRAAAGVLIAEVARHRPVRAQSPKSRREQPYKNALPEPVALPAAIFAAPAVGLTQCGSCAERIGICAGRGGHRASVCRFRNFPPGLCLSRRRKVAWRALRNAVIERLQLPTAGAAAPCARAFGTRAAPLLLRALLPCIAGRSPL